MIRKKTGQSVESDPKKFDPKMMLDRKVTNRKLEEAEWPECSAARRKLEGPDCSDMAAMMMIRKKTGQSVEADPKKFDPKMMFDRKVINRKLEEAEWLECSAARRKLEGPDCSDMAAMMMIRKKTGQSVESDPKKF